MEFKPKIIGFLCNWCCYGGADLCGVSRFQYPPYLRVIRLMCSGRVDLAFVLHAFARGADGVFIGGCHINDCHYNTEGNYDALSMTRLCQKLLELIGVNPDRLRLEWVSAGEGIRFAEITNAFSRTVKALGPLGASEQAVRGELESRLAGVQRLVPYIKIALREKLGVHLTDEKDYATLYSRAEVEALVREAPSYAIDPERCRGCTICLRRCPAGAIRGDKKTVHVIDPGKCIRCGRCLEACPPRFAAVQRICGAPPPALIPDEAREGRHPAPTP